MAHPSHHSSGFISHSGDHHYYRYGNRSSDIEANIIAGVILLLILFVINTVSSYHEDTIKRERISGKEPLRTSYEVTAFLLDSEEFITEPELLVQGLSYFHEKTGVQLVVKTTNQNFSDEKTLNLYNQLFNDESHVLLVIPTTYKQSVEDPIQFYAIGDDANAVITDDTMDYLLENISDTSSGMSWQYSLEEIANIIIE